MQLISAELDDRLDVQVDPDADPVDVDGAVASFLLAYVRSRPAGFSPATIGDAQAEGNEATTGKTT